MGQTEPTPVCSSTSTGRITAHFSVISHADMSTHGSPRLTGPLLFSEMFFHSRRWSWCRNPILPPTSASLCPKCTKLASRRWPVTAFKQPGDFYRVPRHPVRACQMCPNVSSSADMEEYSDDLFSVGR